jgi:hypothetical protein
VNGSNSEGGLSGLLLLPRRPGVRIPREARLIFEWEEGKEECYVIRFPDGTVLARYPLKRLFWKHYTEFLKRLEKSKEESEKEVGNSGWALMHYLRHLKRIGLVKEEEVEIHELAVHMCNVRHMPIDLNSTDDAAFNRLVGLARDGMLLHPLIVVELDPDTAKKLRHVAEVANNYGYNPDEVLTGWLWRIVRPEGDEKAAKIVAKEEDEVYSAVSEFYRRKGRGQPDGTIKYLIIDGYQRYVAYCYIKLKELDTWKAVPKVPVYVIRSGPNVPFVMDPLSVILLSMKANESQRDLFTDERDLEAFTRFLRHFEGVLEALEKLGAKLEHEGIADTGKVIRAQLSQGLSVVSEESPTLSRLEYRISYIGAGEAQPSAVEEEEREERGWMRREEPAIKEAARPVVSETQKIAPTLSYAPAQQQAPVQMPMSPPASAQPIREEAQRSGQPQPVQLDEISVLSAALNQYFARHSPQAHYYVFQGKGIDVRLEYNLKKALESSGLSGRSLEIDIRYTNIPDLPVKGMQLRARVYVPVAWDKYCPSCGHLIVLSPMRCVFCGEVISPLPYVVSYRPAST